MKQTPIQIGTLAMLFALGATASHAATIVQTVGNIDWNANMWGSPAAAPTAGNDYVTATGVTNDLVRISANGGSSTFGGASLRIVSGTAGLLKNSNSTSTINGSLILDGGLINHGPNGGDTSNLAATLDVDGFEVRSASEIQIGNAAGNLTVTAPLTGAGNLALYGTNSQTGDIVSFNGISAFTGTINLGTSGALTLGFGTADYTFSNTLNILGTSVLQVNNGQTLTFTLGDLIDPVNGAVAVGTYTGAGLTGLGANYANNGGTLVVIPEPSAALLGLACLSAVFLRRRRA